MDSDLPKDPDDRSKDRSPILRRLLFVAVVLAALIGLFYIIENQRGERAWSNFKKEMEIKGEHLDLDAFIPAPVPDDENILKVPLMESWFSPHPGISPRPVILIPETWTLSGNWIHGKPTELAEWVEYFYSEVVSNQLAREAKLNEVLPGEETLPLITIEDAPLTDAIRVLGRQAGFNIAFDARITNEPGVPTVTVRWENVTSRQGFYALLNNYNLTAIPEATNSLSLLIVVNSNSWAAERNLLSAIASTNSLEHDTNSAEVMPLITVEDAPIFDAIKTMSRQAGINFQFDPILFQENLALQNRTTTFRHENTTARQVLIDLLKEFNLTAVPSKSGVYRITRRIKTAGDILKAFEEFETEFQDLYAACRKPCSRFEIDYRDRPRPIQFRNFRTIANSLALRASAELALRKANDALRDIKASMRVADCLTNEPSLIGCMVRVATEGTLITPIWEGLASHQWNQEQLLELQNSLARIQLIPEVLNGLRAERASENTLYLNHSSYALSKSMDYSSMGNEELSRKLTRLTVPYVPRSWIYENFIKMNRLHQQTVMDVVDPEKSIISPAKVQAGAAKMDAELKIPTPYTFVAARMMPHFSRLLQHVAQQQTVMNEAIIACALERYRLTHGNFPEKLEALVSEFLAKIPHDIINGKPLNYRLTDDRQYILYSIGWDEKNDNGRSGNWSDETGDWVWRFPVSREVGQ